MGSCSSSSVAAAEQGVSADQERVSKAIDRSLRDDEKRAQQQVKVSNASLIWKSYLLTRI